MKKFTLLLSLILIANGFALTHEEIKDAYYKSYNYEKIENYTDAIKAIMIVYQEYPNGYTVNLRLGWLYYLNENYANSLSHYEKAIQISPYSIEAKLGHLLPLLAQEKYGEVEKEAFKILDVDYYNYYGNLRLIFALRMKEKYDVAEKIALKMLAVYPIDVSFLTEFGLIKHAQGKVDRAIQIFSDVLILDPENITAKNYLKK